jgi:O-antigen/teichoic acid export membrane protein
VLALLAPAIAAFYGEPRLQAVTLALASTFILGGFGVQHSALMRRQMQFKALGLIDLCSMIAGVVAAIALATAGFSYWSLVGMNLVTSVVHLVAVWVAQPWRPGLPVRGSGVGALVRFGSDILGFNIVNYLARKADNLLIGWCWGAGALGLYDKAYTLLLFPISQINHPLGAVATPALARSRANPAELRRYFLTLHHLVACAGIPIVFGIALFAPEIVQLWLGPRWSEAAGLFRLLAVAALVGAMANPTGWLLVSLGLTRRYRNMGLLSSALIVLSFGLGLSYGPQGVAGAYSCAMALMIIPLWYFVLPGTGIKLRDMLANLVTPLVSGGAAVAAGWGVQAWLNPLLPGLAAFALAGVAFAATYAALLLGLFGERDLVAKILQAFRRKSASPTAAPPPQEPPQTP